MPRRIEIELTSAQQDGTWTWRAAGARQPKGSLDGSILPQGASAGDVLRADAEFEIEGITIVSVLPPKEKKREEPARIEVIGPPRAAEPGVTTQLAARTDRRRDGGAGRPPRDRDGCPPCDRDRARTTGGRPDGDRRPARRDGERPADGPQGDRRPERSGGERPRGDRPDRARTPGGPRREGRDGQDGREGRERPEGRPVPAGAAPRADARSRARRLNPANTHRAAVMAGLPPEQQPVAEQVLRGGIPAVRTALHLEREKATAEGRAAPNSDALLAMAEELLPRLKAAEWRDRAEAAVKALDDIALRDLRSVVAGADVARDEESRALATTLRDGLDRRVNGMRTEWSNEITHHLDEGRVVRALRLAGRPPDPQTRVSAELAERLSEVAGQAMTADTPPDRWAAVLDAVAASPVRRSVKPAALPKEPTPDLLRVAHQQAGRVPALAPMLGIAIPPPPGPLRPAGSAGAGRPGSSPRRPRGGPEGGRPEGGRARGERRPPAPAPDTTSAADTTSASDTTSAPDTTSAADTTSASDTTSAPDTATVTPVPAGPETGGGDPTPAEATAAETIAPAAVVAEPGAGEAPGPSAEAVTEAAPADAAPEASAPAEAVPEAAPADPAPEASAPAEAVTEAASVDPAPEASAPAEAVPEAAPAGASPVIPAQAEPATDSATTAAAPNADAAPASDAASAAGPDSAADEEPVPLPDVPTDESPALLDAPDEMMPPPVEGVSPVPSPAAEPADQQGLD